MSVSVLMFSYLRGESTLSGLLWYSEKSSFRRERLLAGAEGIEKLYAEYQRALAVERSRLREEDLDRARLEAHLPLLARLDAVGRQLGRGL